MKKLIRGILAVSAMAAALALTGCDKKNGTTTGGDTTFAGEYRMEAKPLYSEMEAKDPNATAIEMEGMNMTYAQIIAALLLADPVRRPGRHIGHHLPAGRAPWSSYSTTRRTAP